MNPSQILATFCTIPCFIVPSLVFYVFDLEILYNQGLSLKGRVFILKNTDTYKPKAGDTVVFTHPKYRTPILKKVSHGEAQEYQPMVGYAVSSKDDINQTETVPKGHVAVLGDHLKSYDSRYASFGFIPLKNIRGKAWRIF
ncbi:MAG: S26 family signal peptidase [Gammaproteobacteria bacterium]|nr:S26 family signal peptidase [Gammaproteobacteria bacterium]